MYIKFPGRWLATVLSAMVTAAVIYGWTGVQTSAVLGSVFILSGMGCAGLALWQNMTAHGRWLGAQQRVRAVPAWFRAMSARLMPWLRKGEFIYPVGISSTVGIGLPALTVTAHGEVIPADETLEQRVERLLARTDRLNKELTDLRQRHIADIDAVREQISSLDSRLRKADDDLKEHAERIALDTVPIQMRGLILVGLGTLIAALPGIAGW